MGEGGGKDKMTYCTTAPSSSSVHISVISEECQQSPPFYSGGHPVRPPPPRSSHTHTHLSTSICACTLSLSSQGRLLSFLFLSALFSLHRRKTGNICMFYLLLFSVKLTSDCVGRLADVCVLCVPACVCVLCVSVCASHVNAGHPN